ncbi:hypothetical protein GCM10010520_56360 [Rhizobium viscosum]
MEEPSSCGSSFIKRQFVHKVACYAASVTNIVSMVLDPIRHIVEDKRFDARIGRYGMDTLFAAGQPRAIGTSRLA